jgi:hypothetical protein
VSYQDTFYVHPQARWAYLRDKVHTQVGEALNVALGHLGEQNPGLEGVFQHIDFNATIGGRARLNDRQLRDLVRHFSKHRLRNEDFEFPDLLGAAYEYLIGEFADSAGKKGGEFYTPRSVVRMMVRLVEPKQGMEVYDPCGIRRHADPGEGVRRAERRGHPRPAAARPGVQRRHLGVGQAEHAAARDQGRGGPPRRHAGRATRVRRWAQAI